VENQQIKQMILRELPGILQRDPEVREFILRLAREHFADKVETESRFDRLLEELRRDREEQARRWDEQARQWAENEQRWRETQADLRARWEEQERQWAENAQRWRETQADLRARWEDQARRWEEQERRWEENQKIIRQMLADIQALSRKHDSTIGALGARWGLFAEQSFRSALQGILHDTFGVHVTHVTEYDDEGFVFGHPDQVELDLIIRDGVLILCEIKSSMSKGDMYLFERKVRFYEKKHRCQVSRMLVISPMVEQAACQVAERLGIQVYSYAEEVDPTIFGG
jgi:hypothetical protein